MMYQSTCYCTNARRSSNILSEYYDAALCDTGLTVSQYFLLVNLSRLGKANITHWAEWVGLDRSTMVRNVKVLEKYGYLELAEGNGKTFALSEKGKTVLEKAVPAWEQAQSQMETLLGKEDAKALLRIGAKLQQMKGEIGKG